MIKASQYRLEYSIRFICALFSFLYVFRATYCYSIDEFDLTLFNDQSCSDKGYTYRQSVVKGLIPDELEVIGIAEINKEIIINMKGDFSNKILADLLLKIKEIPSVTGKSITIT